MSTFKTVPYTVWSIDIIVIIMFHDLNAMAILQQRAQVEAPYNVSLAITREAEYVNSTSARGYNVL